MFIIFLSKSNNYKTVFESILETIITELIVVLRYFITEHNKVKNVHV